jgi:hemoglobin
MTTAPTNALPDLRDDDLHDLLLAFYATIEKEPLLAPYFAGLDMVAHIPRIADFWSTILFHTGRYSDNAFRPHLEMPGLTAEHFFAGPTATQMKELGHRIAYSMQLRLGIAPFAALREHPEPLPLRRG